MAFDIFRIAIFAVVAIVIIAIGVSFFSTPSENPVERINSGFKAAKNSEGMIVGQKMTFAEGFAATSSAFEKESMNVKIYCNEPSQCTPDSIEYDGRHIKFMKELRMDVFTRCMPETGLWKCAAYFGKKPAQLEVTLLEVSGNNDSIAFVIENSGHEAAENVVDKGVIYKLMTSEGQTKEIEYKELAVETVPIIKAGEKYSSTFYFGRMGSGNYIIKFSTYAEDAGLSRAEATFTVLKETDDDCKATVSGETLIIDGKCVSRYLCEDCDYAYTCQEAWARKTPADAERFQIRDRTYSEIESEPDSKGECRQN